MAKVMPCSCANTDCGFGWHSVTSYCLFISEVNKLTNHLTNFSDM